MCRKQKKKVLRKSCFSAAAAARTTVGGSCQKQTELYSRRQPMRGLTPAERSVGLRNWPFFFRALVLFTLVPVALTSFATCRRLFYEQRL